MATGQKIYQEDGEQNESRLIRLISRLKRFVLSHAWYIHKPTILMIQATPQKCLETLTTATRPSTKRLQHRNLFASGRRYYIESRREGFRMTTTSSVRWRYRKRTSSIAVMWGTFANFGGDITQVTLESRVNIGFLLSTLLVPVGMASLLIYMPWPPVLIASLIFFLFILSWIGHRTNVVLEGQEMIWFVRKVLEDLVPAHILTLDSGTSDVVYDQQDFEKAWEKFYDAHRDG